MKKIISILVLFLALAYTVCASEIFSNNLNDLAEITSAGGVVEGSASFVQGMDGDAVYLPGTSAVRFSNIDFSDSGVVEFWFKPDFDIKDLPRFTTKGLLEVGNFPGPNSMGVWIYRSEYGPVLVFEIKDKNGNYRQVWSRISSFNPKKWHHAAIEWNCNNNKAKKNYARILLDGKKGSKKKNMCADGINLDNKQIRIGDTGYYSGDTATFDKLKAYNNWKDVKQVKKDYKK